MYFVSTILIYSAKKIGHFFPVTPKFPILALYLIIKFWLTLDPSAV